MKWFLMICFTLIFSGTSWAESPVLKITKDGKEFVISESVRQTLAKKLDNIAKNCWLDMGRKTETVWEDALSNGNYFFLKYNEPIVIKTTKRDITANEILFAVPRDSIPAAAERLIHSPLLKNNVEVNNVSKCGGLELIKIQCLPELKNFFDEPYKRGCNRLENISYLDKNTSEDLVQKKKACLEANGEWDKRGLRNDSFCIFPTKDKGKVCSDNSECEGSCIASLTEFQTWRLTNEYGRLFTSSIKTQGTCSPWDQMFGCHAFVKHGLVEEILCVD